MRRSTRFGTDRLAHDAREAREVLDAHGAGDIDRRRAAEGPRHRQEASRRDRPRAVASTRRSSSWTSRPRRCRTKEIDELFLLIELLKEEGKAILFITHKFDEIFRIADRYTVFRDGEMVGEGLIDGRQPEPRSCADGRPLGRPDLSRSATPPIGDVGARRSTACRHPTEFDDISFELRKGEILGFYGLVGAGRSEVMQAHVRHDRTVARHDHARRQADRVRIAGRRDRGRHRLCAGGARQAGRRDRPADLPERLAAVARAAPRKSGFLRLARGVRAGARLHRAARPARRPRSARMSARCRAATSRRS